MTQKFLKYALVLGGGGFIGFHLVRRLVSEGYWVRAVDLKYPEFCKTVAHDFVIADLRNFEHFKEILCHPFQLDSSFDEIYQFAADMGGAGYLFSGKNDAQIMRNSISINVNLLTALSSQRVPSSIFFASSACVYPTYNQDNSSSPLCCEESVYPANPDSEYGWEKLFSERLYLAHAKSLDCNIKIARFHGIFGPYGTWNGGKEKAPAAICRKVASASSEIEVWGDGQQTRSFLYIDDAIEAIIKFMNSSFNGPLNIGSEHLISINAFARLVIKISRKNLTIINTPGPQGVRGRISDNSMIKEMLAWAPSENLEHGLEETYAWILSQLMHTCD
ncbi:NAD-dependent epimerase/dehydratase family protein [Synechococcus sp. AH-603-M21]|nr:NAD-dependent epimerase/dehydratase family protein [Synechococcus sp. AH-603-M21]